ncbi:ATP-dependent helicase, partial [Lactobacillus halodurans]
ISDMNHDKTNFVALDSKMSSQQRKTALQLFSNKKVNLLLTTDVAARGMDINDVNMIVNYMIPRDNSEYVHRSGRTGRMGKSGNVITFGNNHDMRNLQDMVDVEITKTYVDHEGKLSKKQVFDKKKRPVNKSSKPAVKPKKRLRDQKNKGKRNFNKK